MRRLLGLLVLLYGLLLALNTTAPVMAKLAGDRVEAQATRNSDNALECVSPLGSPPFGGLYGNCHVRWSGGEEEGHLFGAQVASRLAAEEQVTAFRYPLLNDYAVLPPSNSEQVAAIIAFLIIVLGALLLGAEMSAAKGSPEVRDRGLLFDP